jgi:hypothetical protein
VGPHPAPTELSQDDVHVDVDDDLDVVVVEDGAVDVSTTFVVDGVRLVAFACAPT